MLTNDVDIHLNLSDFANDQIVTRSKGATGQAGLNCFFLKNYLPPMQTRQLLSQISRA